MDVLSLQQRVGAVSWYHEFDFGNGIRGGPPETPDLLGHRRVWAFIRHELDRIDFRNKRVLDIGSWDGYWSFSAERRGAKSVVATDDRTQNWSDSQGIHLAKELLGSEVQIRQDVSVYDLASLEQKFDVILFLGVYYHLFDPFAALAQIRHCCHSRSLVVIEGSVATGLGSGEARYDYSDNCCRFLPDPDALHQLVGAAYLEEASRVFLNPPAMTTDLESVAVRPRLGWRWRLRTCLDVLQGSRDQIRASVSGMESRSANRRILMTCTPTEGDNPIHLYRPPFGLHQYDPRFRDSADS